MATFRFQVQGEFAAASQVATVAAWAVDILPTAPGDIVRWLNDESLEVPWIEKTLAVLDSFDAGESPIAPSSEFRDTRLQFGEAIRHDPTAERIEVVPESEATRTEVARVSDVDGIGGPTSIALVTPQGRGRRSALAFLTASDPSTATSAASATVISPAVRSVGFDVAFTKAETHWVAEVSRGRSGGLLVRVTKSNTEVPFGDVTIEVKADRRIRFEVVDVVVIDGYEDFPFPLRMKKGVGVADLSSDSLRLRLKGRIRFARFSFRLFARFWPVGRLWMQRSARKPFAKALADFDAKAAESSAWTELVALAEEQR